MAAPDLPKDVESFNRRASGYEASFTQSLFFDPVHRIVLDLAERRIIPKTILDIGCGTGRLLRKAALRWPGAQLIGIDPAEEMLREARRRSPGIAFHHGIAENLPLPDPFVDLVLSTLSFHHWTDQRKSLLEVARVLRRGGYFILADILTPLGFARMFPHGRQAEPDAVWAMFNRAGLRVYYKSRRLGTLVLVTVGKKGR